MQDHPGEIKEKTQQKRQEQQGIYQPF